MNRFDIEDFVMGKIFPVLVVVIMVVATWNTIRNETAWREITSKHECHEVSRRRGHLVMVGGITPMRRSDVILYLCDDGNKYWR